MTKEKVLPPNRLACLPGEFVWWLGETLLRVKIEKRENLEKARTHLQAGGSLIVYFNHSSFLDPGLAYLLLEKNFDLKNYPPPAFLASKKHLDGTRGIINAFHSLVIKSAAYVKGFQLLPVVQEYDRRSYSKNYTEINYPSLLKAIRLLRLPGGILFIAPEETRSKDGRLQEAKEGIEVIFKSKTVREKTMAFPLGIVGQDKIHQDESLLFNPLLPIKLIVGKPLSFREIKTNSEQSKLPIKDSLMVQLAQLLPREYHGFYQELVESNFATSIN